MSDTILNKIIDYKKKWILDKKKKKPLISFKNQINNQTRNFYKSLQEKKPCFILECKKNSPSLGLLRKDFNLYNIAKTYKKHAAAISVLTDEKYFHGDFKFIKKIRNYVNQPILCKDFFIDPYQIYLARYYQADAILLMLSILKNDEYKIMLNIAKKMNMDVLTEIHNEKELNRALNLKAKIIGINNRNLHDLSINIKNTPNLSSLIPNHVTIISESGFKKYSEIKFCNKFVQGFLIGSSLMSKRNLDIGVRSIIFGKNKVCGLTRNIDAQIAVECGAVYGGLIFVKESPRFIKKCTAKIIMLNNNLKYIGVFKNENIKIILEHVQQLCLYAIQLHGNENQEYINELRITLPKKIKIWKAFSIISIIPKLNWKNVDRYVFDAQNGGSNTSFDWSLLKNQILDNVILAGGINIENCIKASQFNCCGLDFNSGIETKPGIKNHQKMKLIFQKLRYFI